MDSAYQIGISTLFKGVLTIDERACGWRFKNREIGNVLASGWRTNGDIAKQRVALGSAYRIGVSTISKDVLTVDEGACGWMFIIAI